MITDWNSSEHTAFNVNFPCQIFRQLCFQGKQLFVKSLNRIGINLQSLHGSLLKDEWKKISLLTECKERTTKYWPKDLSDLSLGLLCFILRPSSLILERFK